MLNKKANLTLRLTGECESQYNISLKELRPLLENLTNSLVIKFPIEIESDGNVTRVAADVENR